jgi:Ser-tRNA(Ala) deacylase AlaX
LFRCSRVVSCAPRATAAEPKGKAKKAPNGGGAAKFLFDVVLADTVLFPEGGGQPSDTGTVGGVR